ncbi:MAG: ZmpA/ZmpB/ZmpC family metallo-endopeptidase-related protein, partial [Christensenellales bacterium]
IVSSQNAGVLNIAYTENGDEFMVYPLGQGSAEVKVRSENGKEKTFVFKVVKGVENLSLGYTLESGKVGKVTYNDGNTQSSDEDTQNTSDISALVKNFGLSEMYLQVNSRIALNVAELPTGATIEPSAFNPFDITTQIDGGYTFNLDSSSGQNVVYLTLTKSGEYNVTYSANAYIKDETSGVWKKGQIIRTFNIKAFEPITELYWTINGQNYYGNNIEFDVYDLDSVAFDYQPYWKHSGVEYYLNKIGINTFISDGTPSLTPSDSSQSVYDNKTNITFSINYKSNTGGKYYINTATTEGLGDTDDSPYINYSIDYAGITEDYLATIWGQNAVVDSSNYQQNNSVQAYSQDGIWLAFTSVLYGESVKQNVYTYKVTALITQAYNITSRATFTINVVQPPRAQNIDVADTKTLDAGGFNNESTTISFGNTFANSLESRVAFSFDAQGLTLEDIKNYQDQRDNGCITYNPSNKTVSLNDIGSYPDKTTLTFYTVDSMRILRDVDNDRYMICMLKDGNLCDVDGTSLGVAMSYSEANEGRLIWACFDASGNLLDFTTVLPVYKTVTININAGSTEETAFAINNPSQFYDFLNKINSGTTFEGKFIKISRSLSGLELSNSTSGVFKGTLFSDQDDPITLTFAQSKDGLFNTLENATIKNINFVFNNFSLSAQTSGLLANSVVSSTIQNVNVSLMTNILNSANNVVNFGAFAGTTSSNVIDDEVTQKTSFKNCSAIFAKTVSDENYASYVGGFVGISEGTDFDHCVVRCYDGKNIIVTEGVAGGLIAKSGGNNKISYSYVIAYEKDNPTISARTVGGLIAFASDSDTISYSFALLNLAGTQVFALTEKANKVEYSFANITTENTLINPTATTLNQTYVLKNKTDLYLSSDLGSLTNLDENYWTTSYPAFNDGYPLLLDIDGSVLYDKVLTELNCPVKDKVSTLIKSEQTYIIVFAGQNYNLNALVDTSCIDAFDIKLIFNGEAIKFNQTNTKNVGEIQLSFVYAGEYVLT